MKKLLLPILLLSLFFLPSVVKAQLINVTIVSPAATGRYQDALSIEVYITSTYSMDTVKATVNGRSVLLTRNPSDGYFEGTLSLTGLAQGLHQIDIYTLDALGNSLHTLRQFTYDSYPIVTIQSPTSYTFYQNKVHIKATVSDPGHLNCAGTVYYPNNIPVPINSFNFVNSIDTLVDLYPQSSSGQVILTVKAVDSANQVTQSSVTVSWDKSPFLSPVYTDSGGIVDYDGTRVLVQTGSALKIVNLTDNTSQNIPTANRSINSARLTNSGAVMVLFPTNTSRDSIYVWKSSTSTLTNINAATNTSLDSYEFSVNGDNIIWYSQIEQLSLTNANTLVTTLVDNNQVLNNGNGIDSLGNISYSATHDIYKYAIPTQTKTRITTDGSGTIFNSYSSIEGNRIAYIKTLTGSPSRLYLYDGTKNNDLGVSPTNILGVQLRNGYLAYSKFDNNSIPQVWLRRPDTSSQQISFFSGTSTVNRLGNKGSMLVQTGTSLYYADSLTAARLVSGYGTTFYINNNFYVAIGNTLLKYVNLAAPNIAAIVTSFSPAATGKGDTVKIKGSHFTGATGVSFGGVSAVSYRVIGDTTIMAVVGTGATGSVSVAAYSGGAGSLAGFTFVPAPTITSFTPAASGTGATITMTGTGFTGATAVSFGGTAATSFNVVSPTQITAVVATGTTGSVSVATPGGTITKTGYTFLPLPVISTNTTIPSFLSGSSISLYASTGPNFTYQWALDGVDIPDAIHYSLVAYRGGSYTVRIISGTASVTSAPFAVTLIFDLPAASFVITATDASCKGVKNGYIYISTTVVLVPLTAEISGNGIDSVYHFNGSVYASNLGAGTYSVCITVDGQADYKQCFTAVVGEPKDLTVFTNVSPTNQTVTLSLNGGNLYTVNLNGVNYTTTGSQLTLNLLKGDNVVTVSTDKECQGIIVKHIGVGNDITLYPNPVNKLLNITLGKDTSKIVAVEVRDMNGNVVYSGKYPNQYGAIQVDLSSLNLGVHALKLTLDNSVSIFKIIKQ